MGSSLEYEYSVTYGAVKEAWYSPCVRQSLVGASAMIMGGKVRWVIGCVCGRVLSWCEMVNAWRWERVMELCSGYEWVWDWGGPWLIAGKFWNGP